MCTHHTFRWSAFRCSSVSSSRASSRRSAGIPSRFCGMVDMLYIDLRQDINIGSSFTIVGLSKVKLNVLPGQREGLFVVGNKESVSSRGALLLPFPAKAAARGVLLKRR